MPQRPTAEDDRRRTPRFSCGGQVQISRLPSDGIFLPGKIRDLSLGGCRVDLLHALDCGARAEIVVRVRASSFRALSEVKATQGPSGARLEFLRLSHSGRDELAELLAELEQMQKLEHKLKSPRREINREKFRQELQDGRLAFATESGTPGQRLVFLGTILTTETAKEDPALIGGREEMLVLDELRVTQVDLFG